MERTKVSGLRSCRSYRKVMFSGMYVCPSVCSFGWPIPYDLLKLVHFGKLVVGSDWKILLDMHSYVIVTILPISLSWTWKTNNLGVFTVSIKDLNEQYEPVLHLTIYIYCMYVYLLHKRTAVKQTRIPPSTEPTAVNPKTSPSVKEFGRDSDLCIYLWKLTWWLWEFFKID